jgi:hypothetical protein
MQELDAAVKENNLVFMNEIGLDPDWSYECHESDWRD